MSRILINEVYFVSKLACAKRAREGGREREGGKEGQAFQSTRCNSSPSMSRIPINEATTCTSSPSSGKARNL